MKIVSGQENQSVFSELQCLKENFVALEQDNQRLLGDLQQISLEKLQMQQQHDELVLHVQQLEATIVSLQQHGPSTQGNIKDPRLVFLQNSMGSDHNSEDSLIRFVL